MAPSAKNLAANLNIPMHSPSNPAPKRSANGSNNNNNNDNNNSSNTDKLQQTPTPASPVAKEEASGLPQNTMMRRKVPGVGAAANRGKRTFDETALNAETKDFASPQTSTNKKEKKQKSSCCRTFWGWVYEIITWIVILILFSAAFTLWLPTSKYAHIGKKSPLFQQAHKDLTAFIRDAQGYGRYARQYAETKFTEFQQSDFVQIQILGKDVNEHHHKKFEQKFGRHFVPPVEDNEMVTDEVSNEIVDLD